MDEKKPSGFSLVDEKYDENDQKKMGFPRKKERIKPGEPTAGRFAAHGA